MKPISGGRSVSNNFSRSVCLSLAFVVVLVVLAAGLAGPAGAASSDRLYAVGYNGTYLPYTTPWTTGPDNATGKVGLYLLDATTGRQAAGVLLDGPAYYRAISTSGKWIGLPNGQSKDVTIANANLTTVAKVPLNTSPWGIAFSPNDSVLYVALPAERAIVALDAPNGTISWRVSLEDAPYDLAVSPSGRRIYATNTADDSFTVVDVIAKRPLVTVPSRAKPMDVVASPDGTSIYVAAWGDDSIVVYDAVNYPVKAVVSGVKAPAYLALDPAGRRLFVTSFQGSDVAVVNTVSYGIDKVWSAGASGLGRPAVSGDGNRVLVPSQADGGIGVFDATTAGRVGVINSTGPVMAMARYTVPPGEPFYVSPTPAPASSPVPPGGSATPAPAGASFLDWITRNTLDPIAQNKVLFLLILFVVVLLALSGITYYMMFSERRPKE